MKKTQKPKIHKQKLNKIQQEQRKMSLHKVVVGCCEQEFLKLITFV